MTGKNMQQSLGSGPRKKSKLGSYGIMKAKEVSFKVGDSSTWMEDHLGRPGAVGIKNKN